MPCDSAQHPLPIAAAHYLSGNASRRRVAAEQYGHRDGDIELSDLVERGVKIVRPQGFSIHDIEGEVGNLRDFIREALARVNRTEDARSDRHRNNG